MKKVATIIFLSIVTLSNSQISPLLDYDSWLIEQIETDDQTIVYDEDDPGFLFIYISTTPDEMTLVNFNTGGCEYELFFDDENQSFTTLHYGCTLSLDNYPSIEIDLATIFFLETYHPDPENCNCPYTYEFRDEGNKVYLDITNIEGNIATLSNSTLSNTNFDKVALNIYPNPTSNLLHIETKQTAITAVEIFDLQGKQVMQLNSTDLKNVDVSQLTNGMYFIKVSTSEGVLTKKFVKK